MNAENRKLKVFLSYASQDRPVVRELYERLRNESWIEPWLDVENITLGQRWTSVIEDALDEADAIIVFLSSNSVQKEGFIQRELNYAWELSLEKPHGVIFLIPLRLDECPVPRYLRSRQWGDYFGETKKTVYSTLLRSLLERKQQVLQAGEVEKSSQEIFKEMDGGKFEIKEESSRQAENEKYHKSNLAIDKSQEEGTKYGFAFYPSLLRRIEGEEKDNVLEKQEPKYDSGVYQRGNLLKLIENETVSDDSKQQDEQYSSDGYQRGRLLQRIESGTTPERNVPYWDTENNEIKKTNFVFYKSPLALVFLFTVILITVGSTLVANELIHMGFELINIRVPRPYLERLIALVFGVSLGIIFASNHLEDGAIFFLDSLWEVFLNSTIDIAFPLSLLSLYFSTITLSLIINIVFGTYDNIYYWVVSVFMFSMLLGSILNEYF